MTEPVILAFDTSRPHCAAAVIQDDRVLATREEPMARGQAERLMPLITEAMARAGVSLDDLQAIAVGTGPGNFTGIRLSVAAARGLALGTGLPAVGITSLEALAAGHPRPCRVALDARRGAAYVQRFDVGADHPPALLDDLSRLPRDLPLLGDVPGATWPATPLAVLIAGAARTRLGRPQPRPAPLYIRPADAAPARDLAPPLLP